MGCGNAKQKLETLQISKRMITRKTTKLTCDDVLVYPREHVVRISHHPIDADQSESVEIVEYTLAYPEQL
jgi:hypothetical protein